MAPTKWIRILALVAGIASVHAAENSGSVAVSLTLGADSNPLKLSDGARSGAYTELRVTGGAKTRLAEGVQLFFTGDGAARRHQAGVSDADLGRAELRAGMSLTPYRNGVHRLSFSGGGYGSLARSTFTDRVTGRPFEVEASPPTLPPTTTPIPDRFDSNSKGAFLDVLWGVSKRVRLSLESKTESRNYVEDYSDRTSLYPLDSRAVSVEPSIRIQASDVVAFELALPWTERRYRELPALDASGEEVPGTLRRDRYAGIRCTVHVAPGPRWDLDVGVDGGAREDPYAGYYDSTARAAFVLFGLNAGTKNRFQLYVSQYGLDYPHAKITDDPSSANRASDTSRWLGRFDRKLARGFSLLAELGVQRNDNRDPQFAYERKWAMTGFKFRR